MASRAAHRVLGRISAPLQQATLHNSHGIRRFATTNLHHVPRQTQASHPAYVQNAILRRWLSNEPRQIRLYEFNHIKSMSESPQSKRTLIDVREPSEYQAGYIPTAINLPVNSQPDALTLSEEDFEDRYGFSKPALDQEVVFYCKAGVRSGHAASIAQQQGYTNVSEYKGSWTDWAERGGKAAK